MQMQFNLGTASAPRGIGWERFGGWNGGTCGSYHAMTLSGVRTGWGVRHCGHPTALRPYYIHNASGQPSQRKYRLLAEAKIDAARDYQEAQR